MNNVEHNKYKNKIRNMVKYVKHLRFLYAHILILKCTPPVKTMRYIE